MRESLRKTLAGLLAVLLVSTAAAPVGTAAAQTSENTCSNVEQAAIALSLGYGGIFNDCNNIDTSGDVGTGLSAEETNTQLYSYATGVTGNREVFKDTLDNYLNDTKTIARLEGKTAYVQALDNNSDLTKAEAKLEAIAAVEDYYATKQRQLINQWEVGTEAARYAIRTADAAEETNVSAVTDIGVWTDGTYRGEFSVDLVNNKDGEKLFASLLSGTDHEETAKLVNGEDVTYDTIKIGKKDPFNVKLNKFHDMYGDYYTNVSYARHQAEHTLWRLEVWPPNSLPNQSPVNLLEHDRYVERWKQIKHQEQNVTAEIDDLVSGTYTEVQDGEITPEDMVDPYMGAREYDPDNETLGSSWALRTAMSLGLAPPENLSSMGSMTVRNETTGETHTGMLMSDSAPPQSDGFAVGETYNASAISGTQMVAGTDGMHHSLNTRFTLVNATNTDGTAIADGTTIGYGSSPSYAATNLSEWQEQMSAATNRTVEIQVRQQRIGGNGTQNKGTGIEWPDVGGLPFGGAGVVVAILVLFGMAAVGRSN
jgi:hypothetical protein